MLAKDRTRTHIASNDPATLKKYKKTDNYNHTIIKYIENVRTMSKSTASQYQKRLKSFVSFVEQEYEYNVDILIDKVKEQRMDVYDVLSGFASFLVNRGTFSSLSIKNWVDTAKNLLEFFDIDVSPKKFKMKVRLPKVVRKSKDALTKELIVEILNACSDIRLKTYVLLLAELG